MSHVLSAKSLQHSQFGPSGCSLLQGDMFSLGDLAGSGILNLECFKQIWASGEVAVVNVPQCVLGFIVDGQPVYKNTTLLASFVLLFKPFAGCRCTHQHHGVLTEIVGCVCTIRLTQVWPRAMRQKVCNGIQSLLRACRRGHEVHASDMCPIVPGR